MRNSFTCFTRRFCRKYRLKSVVLVFLLITLIVALKSRLKKKLTNTHDLLYSERRTEIVRNLDDIFSGGEQKHVEAITFTLRSGDFLRNMEGDEEKVKDKKKENQMKRKKTTMHEKKEKKVRKTKKENEMLRKKNNEKTEHGNTKKKNEKKRRKDKNEDDKTKDEKKEKTVEKTKKEKMQRKKNGEKTKHVNTKKENEKKEANKTTDEKKEKKVRQMYIENETQRKKDEETEHGNTKKENENERTHQDKQQADDTKGEKTKKKREKGEMKNAENTRGEEEMKGGIPVVIVEEHHDVIPHWFAAVDAGLLPRRGNVLVHIDAHPDAALPVIDSSFPLFRYPDVRELVYLMQRNDRFIASAGLTGLFSRYIWIVPPWDRTLNAALGDTGYARYHLTVGPADLSVGPVDLSVSPADLSVSPADLSVGPADFSVGPADVSRDKGLTKGGDAAKVDEESVTALCYCLEPHNEGPGGDLSSHNPHPEDALTAGEMTDSINESSRTSSHDHYHEADTLRSGTSGVKIDKNHMTSQTPDYRRTEDETRFTNPPAHGCYLQEPNRARATLRSSGKFISRRRCRAELRVLVEVVTENIAQELLMADDQLTHKTMASDEEHTKLLLSEKSQKVPRSTNVEIPRIDLHYSYDDIVKKPGKQWLSKSTVSNDKKLVVKKEVPSLKNKKTELLRVSDHDNSNGLNFEAKIHDKQRHTTPSLLKENPKSPWLSPDTSVILDIDEDYYGVEPAITPLLNAGMTVTVITRVSRIVSKIFCPWTSKQESVTNEIFNDLLQTVHRARDYCRRDNGCVSYLELDAQRLSADLKLNAKRLSAVLKLNATRKSADFKINAKRLSNELKFNVQRVSADDRTANAARFSDDLKLYAKLSAKLKKQIEHGAYPGLLCGEVIRGTETSLEELVEQLVLLTDRQLLALGKVGICLRQSPNTMGFEPRRGAMLCTGYNRPDNSVVAFHVPDKEEIHTRSLALLRLLKTTRSTPRIVTLARSVRDGYTPRDAFASIEADLVHILRDAFPEVADSAVIYDKHLLGGKDGWWTRH